MDPFAEVSCCEFLHSEISACERFDIFIPCWANDFDRDRQLNPYVGFEEMFQERNHYMGNIRWIFYRCQRFMETVRHFYFVANVREFVQHILFYNDTGRFIYSSALPSYEKLEKCFIRLPSRHLYRDLHPKQ